QPHDDAAPHQNIHAGEDLTGRSAPNRDIASPTPTKLRDLRREGSGSAALPGSLPRRQGLPHSGTTPAPVLPRPHGHWGPRSGRQSPALRPAVSPARRE